jgi:1,3-propanediol dehydrogenase
MSSIFLMPPKMITGSGAISKLCEHLRGKGKKAFIVTDGSMIKFKTAGKLTAILEQAGITYEIYAEVNGEPTDAIVAKGVQHFKQAKCDCIIALGGGSPIDAAKAIGFMASSGGKIRSFMKTEITSPLPYFVAIPTTAGTGSEVTQFTIITDTGKNEKMLLKGPALIPQLAVIDPDLTLTIPPHVTVATGLDALTHAIEAYTSRKAQPLADSFALSAIKRIYQHLETAYRDGGNLEARQQLSLAALEAGIAFNNSSVTLVHGMSRPIGALFHIAHGVSNALLLTRCLEFLVPGNPARFAKIADVMGITGPGRSEEETCNALLRELDHFCKVLKVPALPDLQVEKRQFYNHLTKMAEDALASGSPANAFRIPGQQDIMEIYQKLWPDH